MSRFQSILLRTWVPSLGENKRQVGHEPMGGLSSLSVLLFIPLMISCARHMAAGCYHGLLFSLSFPSETIWSPFKTCVWSWTSLWGCKCFVYLQKPEDCLSCLLLPLDTLLKGLKTFMAVGIFSWTQDTRKSLLAGSGHSMTMPHLFSQSL